MDIPSGMVRSLRKVRLLTQSSGLTVAVGMSIVGSGVILTTTGSVGWMMSVGSTRGTCAVGGTKGVGVGADEQAEVRKMPMKSNSFRLAAKRKLGVISLLNHQDTENAENV